MEFIPYWTYIRAVFLHKTEKPISVFLHVYFLIIELGVPYNDNDEIFREKTGFSTIKILHVC